ncbi:MAG: hypothetical protein EXS42_00435 [Lacunisphaera sp.]|nr:hypothetical protein [Lacunisphaera sp.]
MSAPATPSPAPARPLVILFLGLLGLTLWFTTRAWHASILDRHEFRQLQTAVSAYWMKEAGYQLDYETPVFGPPWSIPMEFPVYQWIVATTSRLLGTPLEGTARGVSLGFFLAALPAVYGLAGFLALVPSRRLLVVSTVLASPTYLFYARTFMIETTALCFSVWFLYALAHAVRDPSVRWAVGATALATLAALAKATTFIIFLVPGAAIFLWLWLPSWRRRDESGARAWLRAVLAACPALVAVTVAAWWVKHADHVKDSNPFSGFLTSRELVKWNWGTLEQRLSGEFWSASWSNISSFVLGEVPLAVLLLCAALVGSPFRRVAAWCAAFFLGGVLLFSNLFYHHDYYYCANALLLLFGAGALLAGVWDNLRLPFAARMLALGLFFGGQVLLYYRGYAEHTRHPPAPPPGIATVIRDSVPPDGVVLIYGWDWSSQLPYFSQRRAITVPEGREDEFKVLGDILNKLPPRRLAAMVVRHDPRRLDRLGFVRERTNRFKFSPAPFATSAEGELYLPEDAIPAAAAKLQGRSFSDVTLNTRPAADPNEAKLQVNDLGALDFPMTTPRPIGARSMFGINVGEAGLGRKVILAHPDSELSFAPPPGTTRITAEVGISAAAYAPDATAVTDGVRVEIFELRTEGLRRVLYQRDLNPVKEPGDRGPQPISLNAAGPFNGILVFKITPGPKNNIVNDWAYWGSIRIQ